MLSSITFWLLGILLQFDLVSGFQNPVRYNSSDPSLVYANGYYYLTYTSATRIEIVRSPLLSGLRNGETKTVWTDSDTTRNADIWAPEIHRIDNRWYLFYSSRNANVVNTYRTRVLRGCTGSNPYDCTYSFGATLVPPAGKQGGSDGNDAYSIDGSYMEIPGKGRYHLVSMHNEDGYQSIGITNLDTDNWTVDEWHIISRPDQAWEQHMGGGAGLLATAGLNEGPYALYHGDDIWLSYSGSTCDVPEYALGLLYYNGGDPLDISSWEKSGPVFTSANGNYGTAHNAFFTSPDGTEIWNIFHATSISTGNCGPARYTMAQKVTFNAQGNPNLGQAPALGTEITPPSGE
ncbi:unnamed protein product [Clonostachys solani]|uniref:Glycoside hydrolase family 43 protein n=1 Tax=Clonostachys solani TaxID=160281 RepID=A0A9N9WA73_9HYPO|nr:unnamed protein product [Clonostachys solani]